MVSSGRRRKSKVKRRPRTSGNMNRANRKLDPKPSEKIRKKKATLDLQKAHVHVRSHLLLDSSRFKLSPLDDRVQQIKICLDAYI